MFINVDFDICCVDGVDGYLLVKVIFDLGVEMFVFDIKVFELWGGFVV